MYEVVIFEGAKECLSIDPENLESICRCCLHEKAETNIFETEYHGILFIKILTKLFAINDMEADDFPKNICENCSELLADLCDFKEKIDQSSAILKVALDEVNDSTEETNIYDMSHFSTVTGLENIKFLEEGIFSHDVQPPCAKTLLSNNIDLSEGIKPKHEKYKCENRENVICSESIEFGSNNDNGVVENIKYCDNSSENQPCMEDTSKIYSEEKVMETNTNVIQSEKYLSIPDGEVDKGKEKNGSEYGCKENDSSISQTETYTEATATSFYDSWKQIFNEALVDNIPSNIPSNQDTNEKYLEERANNSNYSFDSDLHYSEKSTNEESLEGKINKNHFTITETSENVKSPEKDELYLGNVEETIFFEPEKTHSNGICEEILEKAECQKILEIASEVDDINERISYDDGSKGKNDSSISKTEIYNEETNSNDVGIEILEKAECYRVLSSEVDDINKKISCDDDSMEKYDSYTSQAELYNEYDPVETCPNDVCEEILEKVECYETLASAMDDIHDSSISRTEIFESGDLGRQLNEVCAEILEKVECYTTLSSAVDDVNEKISVDDDSKKKNDSYSSQAELYNEYDPVETCPNDVCEEIFEKVECYKTSASAMDDIHDSSISRTEIFESGDLGRQLNEVCAEILEKAECYTTLSSEVDDINEKISVDDDSKKKNDSYSSQAELYNEYDPVETCPNDVCEEILDKVECYETLASAMDDIHDSSISRTEIFESGHLGRQLNEVCAEILEKAECYTTLSIEVDDINEKISVDDGSKKKNDSYSSQAELYNEYDPVETCPNNVCEEILEKAECYETLASDMNDIHDSSISQTEIYNESGHLERQLNEVEEVLEKAECYTTLSSEVDDSSISQTDIYNEPNPVETHSNDVCEDFLGKVQCCRSLASEMDDIKESPFSRSEIFNESDPVAHSNDACKENLEIYNDCEIVETHSNDALEENLEKAECSKIFVGEVNDNETKKCDPVETHSNHACEDNLKKDDPSEINEADASKESCSFVDCCNDSPVSPTEIYNECELVAETHSNDGCEDNLKKVESTGILISEVDDIKESISCDYRSNDSLISRTEIYNECDHLETELNDVREEILEEAEGSNILVGEVDVIEKNVSFKEKNDSSVSETEMYKVCDQHLNNASEELLEKADNVKEDKNQDSNMMIGDENALGHDKNVNKLSSTISCDITNVDFDITENKKELMRQDMNKKEIKICLLKLDIDRAIKSDACVNTKEKLSAQKMDSSETMDKPINTFLCTVCRSEFGTNMDLTEHKNSGCSDNLKTGKKVRGRASFLNKWHVSQLETEGALCSCGKRCPNINILIEHMNVDHGDKKYLKCGYCFREFIRKGAFKNHLKAHIKKNC